MPHGEARLTLRSKSDFELKAEFVWRMRVSAARVLRHPQSDVAVETAHILFLTYRRDVVEMAVLRCAELGDKAGIASWKKILKERRKLATANVKHSGAMN
jgi:hypothetical protein